MDEIFIIIGLILLNGVFSMSEVALISARKSRLATDEKKGSKGARIALNLANDPDRFLSTVQIGITLIGILTGIFSGNKIAAELTALLTGMGLAQAYAAPLAQALIVIVVTFLTIVFGELVPKRIGLSMAESVARTLSRPMQWLSVVTLPFVWLLSRTTELIFNLLGIRETDNKVTEEEIKSIIQEGTADGEVQPVEQDIVQRVFLLGDLKVSSIMTHRSDLVWLDTEMSTEEMRRVILDDLFEMYPVCDGDLDHVIGTINLKEVMTHFNDNPLNLKELARQAVYFHENMHVYKVLEQMKAQKSAAGWCVTSSAPARASSPCVISWRRLWAAWRTRMRTTPTLSNATARRAGSLTGSATSLTSSTTFTATTSLRALTIKPWPACCSNSCTTYPKAAKRSLGKTLPLRWLTWTAYALTRCSLRWPHPLTARSPTPRPRARPEPDPLRRPIVHP